MRFMILLVEKFTSNGGRKFDRDALFVTQPKGLKIRDATLTPQGLLAGGCLQICFFSI